MVEFASGENLPWIAITQVCHHWRFITLLTAQIRCELSRLKMRVPSMGILGREVITTTAHIYLHPLRLPPTKPSRNPACCRCFSAIRGSAKPSLYEFRSV
jgi:hypothetical protein